MSQRSSAVMFESNNHMKPVILLSASLALLTGCLPTSTHPLSSIETAPSEEKLAGTWYGKSGEDQIFLHFVPGSGAEIQVVEVDHEKKGEAHTTLYHAFPTVIGGNHYLSVREGNQESYYFARYQLSSAGALTFTLMGETAAAKAISSGKIKGKITGNEQSKDVKITDSTEHLAAFVAKSDPDLLFDQKFGTFKRVTLPSLDEAKPTPKKAAPTKSRHTAPAKKKRTQE